MRLKHLDRASGCGRLICDENKCYVKLGHLFANGTRQDDLSFKITNSFIISGLDVKADLSALAQ